MQLDIDITESNMGDLLAGGTSSEAASITISDVLVWGPPMVWFHLHLCVQIVFVLYYFILKIHIGINGKMPKGYNEFTQ